MSETFLWKPRSEGDGNLVVLTPNSLNGKIVKAGVRYPDGRFDEGRFTGDNKNGNRGHYRFGQSGGKYPPGSTFEMVLDDGRVLTQSVGQTGSRLESNVSELRASSAASDEGSGGAPVMSINLPGGGGSGGPGSIPVGTSTSDYVFTDGIFKGWRFEDARNFLIQQELEKREAYKAAGLIEEPPEEFTMKDQALLAGGTALMPIIGDRLLDAAPGLWKAGKEAVGSALGSAASQAANQGASYAASASEIVPSLSSVVPAGPAPGAVGAQGLGEIGALPEFSFSPSAVTQAPSSAASSLASASPVESSVGAAPAETGMTGKLGAALGNFATGLQAGTIGNIGGGIGAAPSSVTGAAGTLGYVAPAAIAAGVAGKELYDAFTGDHYKDDAKFTGLNGPTYIASLFGSGRSKDARKRQSMREDFNELNPEFYSGDANSLITFSDGSSYDIRDDFRPDADINRKSIDVDGSMLEADPTLGDQYGRVSALTKALMGAGDESRWFGNELFNAATHSGGDIESNIQDIYDNGPGWGDLKHNILQQWEAGDIDAWERDANWAAIDKQYGVKNESGARWEDQAELTDSQRARNDRELKGRKK